MQEQWKILVVMTFLGILGCGKGYPKLESPKKPIEVVVNSQDDLSRGRLGIKKSQFNKDFLMIPTMRSVSAKPQWESFAPKVVQFQRAGKYVSLNERIIDRVYDEISTNDDALLLQSFEITSETDDVVYINWKFGFDWIPESNHDDEDLAGDSSTKQVALDVVESFTKKLEFQGDTFVSEQRIRIREPELIKGRDLVNNELVYDLNIKMRPYSVMEQFATRESRLMQGFGMFTIPRLRKNQNKSYDLITRWDITNKPIQIAMSSAIPSEYADAIQEGFEYWNRVLNRKVVEVQRGASPSSQLQEGQVIVHWVNWDDAGFAYADMQNDPITGQTLQGQIYLTSSWVKFAELDQEVHTRRVGISDHSAGHIRLGGFGRANSCSRPVPKEISRVVHARNLDERKNNISHVLRVVVAHEMGHVLGMRHNFAGTMDAPVGIDDIKKAWSQFSDRGVVVPLPISSTVMDYENGMDTFSLGAYIKKEILPYDHRVLKWAYEGVDPQAGKPLPVFCTDEDLNQFFGCSMFDSSKQPMVLALEESKLDLNEVIPRSFQRLTKLVFPIGGERKNVHEVLNDFTFKVPTLQADIMRNLFAKSLSSVEFLNQDSWKDEPSEEKTADWRANMLKSAGYFEGVLKSASFLREDLRPDARLMTETLEQGLNGLAPSGTNYLGQKYEFTAEEFAEIKEFYREQFDGIGKTILKSVLNSIAPGKSVDPVTKKNHTTQYKLTDLNGPNESVFETLKKLILASEPEQKTWKGSLIQVPKRFYKNTVLQRALSFYDTQYFPDKKIRAARQDLIKALKSDLAIVFAGTPYEGKIQDLSATKIASLVQASEYADFQDWLKRDLEILIAVESFERSDRNPFH